MAHPNQHLFGYLKNAQTIAQMINKSNKQVVVYWFFTCYTLPNKKLQSFLNPPKHVIGLHVANNPFMEMKMLEHATNQKIDYYTIHGTSTKTAQLIWHRNGQTQAQIPNDFKFISFHNLPTYSLDKLCYKSTIENATKLAQIEISVNHVLSMHPEWLFKSNGKDRGRFYETLKNLLEI
jgi:hypothetical protein